jgi:N-acetylglutamate synthase-like GNAT family acetyltransferase
VAVVTAVPRAARPEDVEPARALLGGAGLPLAGVEDHFAGYWALDAPDGGLAGVVGAERYGAAWLLRSLVVDSSRRGRGLGAALLATVLGEARRHGAREVLLLTTDAQGFFARHGFAEVPRSHAPDEMRASAELNGACPDTATLMRMEVLP